MVVFFFERGLQVRTSCASKEAYFHLGLDDWGTQNSRCNDLEVPFLSA